MDALTALLGRTSPGRLIEPGPSGDQLHAMLEAGASAPDHGRLRPWRFIIIGNDARADLGDVLAAALAQREPSAPPQKLEAERKKPLRAPCIIVVVAKPRNHPGVPHIEQLFAVAACTQNIILAAHALGFGGFWRTGISAYDDTVKDALGVSASEQIIGYVYVGTAAAPGKSREIDISQSVMRWEGPQCGPDT